MVCVFCNKKNCVVIMPPLQTNKGLIQEEAECTKCGYTWYTDNEMSSKETS